ncbi:MAG: LPXTG cell wall anchor domain-containing protein, partial [Anaerolineae bacterium]|nr:LPXTG cell wall anchor domain-containing protein [Anaerolineae bacterium]
TETVALSLPGITLEEGTVYTVYAMGFAGGGEPALTAVISVDAQRSAMLPATGANNTAIFAGLFFAGLALVALSFRARRAEVVA